MAPMPTTRLLIATTVAAGDADSLPPLVRGLIAASTERLLITPPLEGRLHWLVSDTDAATHQADDRLNTVLEHLDSLPAPAAGLISDDSPITAFDDAVSQFRPDHILIGVRVETAAAGKSTTSSTDYAIASISP